MAAQYDRDVRTYTTLLPSSPASLQGSLAQALAPALAGRTLASGFLAQLIGQLPSSGAGDATSVLTNLVQSLPGEINALAAFLEEREASAGAPGRDLAGGHHRHAACSTPVSRSCRASSRRCRPRCRPWSATS